MAKSSCRYNGNTNCDRTELHTWISSLAWQRALRVKHLQLSMLTQAECHWQHGLAHQDQYRQRHIEENCSVLLPTLVSGSTLLSCDHPNHVSRNQHWNGAPFGFQCCFLFNKSRIVTKNRSISKAKIDNCQLHSSLQSCVIWIALGGPTMKPPNTPLYGHTSSQIFKPVGSLTRQSTGPGWQISSPTECPTIVKARALCYPLAKPSAGLSRQLWQLLQPWVLAHSRYTDPNAYVAKGSKILV